MILHKESTKKACIKCVNVLMCKCVSIFPKHYRGIAEGSIGRVEIL